MFLLTTSALRISGICGIIGSILFILGDLSYAHIPGSSKTPTQKMSGMPESRLLKAGILGLIGCWFYTFASLHLYLAFRPAGEVFAFIILLANAVVMICYGISHTAYFSIAAGAQVAVKLGSDAETGGHLGNDLFKRLVTITYFPVAILSLMEIYAILAGKSLYPWWGVFFLPVILYLLKTPVTRLLRGHLKELINDCYDNFVLLVFYLVSTVLLWNGLTF